MLKVPAAFHDIEQKYSHPLDMPHILVVTHQPHIRRTAAAFGSTAGNDIKTAEALVFEKDVPAWTGVTEGARFVRKICPQ